MPWSIIAFVLAVGFFTVEAFRTKSLIAAGLALLALAFIVTGSAPIK